MLHFPHSIITSPVHVTSPSHQHLNLNCHYRNRHLTVTTNVSAAKTPRTQKADGAADGQHIESRTHYYTRINQDYTENNDQQSYYHHHHLSRSHLLSSNEHLSIKHPFGHLLMLSELSSVTWNSPEAHDRSDTFDHSQSWKAFAS